MCVAIDIRDICTYVYGVALKSWESLGTWLGLGLIVENKQPTLPQNFHAAAGEVENPLCMACILHAIYDGMIRML